MGDKDDDSDDEAFLAPLPRFESRAALLDIRGPASNHEVSGSCAIILLIFSHNGFLPFFFGITFSP